jgi:hypothetical protein
VGVEASQCEARSARLSGYRFLTIELISTMPTTTQGPIFKEEFARSKQSNVMLSRVAGSLYWMSRYLERAENVARLLDVNLQLLLDFGELDDQSLKEHWGPILQAIGDEECDRFHHVLCRKPELVGLLSFECEGERSAGSGSDFRGDVDRVERCLPLHQQP